MAHDSPAPLFDDEENLSPYDEAAQEVRAQSELELKLLVGTGVVILAATGLYFSIDNWRTALKRRRRAKRAAKSLFIEAPRIRLHGRFKGR